jgi:hypothetical protein
LFNDFPLLLCRLLQGVIKIKSKCIQSDLFKDLLILRHLFISDSLIILSYYRFFEGKEIGCIRKFKRLELIGKR